jgi:hypothetical protein
MAVYAAVLVPEAPADLYSDTLSDEYDIWCSWESLVMGPIPEAQVMQRSAQRDLRFGVL